MTSMYRKLATQKQTFGSAELLLNRIALKLMTTWLYSTCGSRKSLWVYNTRDFVDGITARQETNLQWLLSEPIELNFENKLAVMIVADQHICYFLFKGHSQDIQSSYTQIMRVQRLSYIRHLCVLVLWNEWRLAPTCEGQVGGQKWKGRKRLNEMAANERKRNVTE